jgi:hypothetical protein
LQQQFSGANNPMFGKSAWAGKKHTEETKRKLSEQRKRLCLTGEYLRMWLDRMAAFHTGETRRRIAKWREIGQPI